MQKEKENADICRSYTSRWQSQAAGPGISRMLPEEMLIHVNTSPLKASGVCCWGSWEHCSLPSNSQLRVGLDDPQRSLPNPYHSVILFSSSRAQRLPPPQPRLPPHQLGQAPQPTCLPAHHRYLLWAPLCRERGSRPSPVPRAKQEL